MKQKKILVCVGTRPNLIKITQFERAFQKYPKLNFILLHTGQHYDDKMNNVFFEELGIKKPDIQFTLEGGSQTQVIAQIMEKFEAACQEIMPDLVMVPGDVNSSFACAFVANRLGIPVAHIESGLRSFDMTMPEEVNRILIDDLSVLHFVTEKSGVENLEKLGFKNSINFVGNSMIDTLVHYEEKINDDPVLNNNNLLEKEYALVTFHRPSNVDNEKDLTHLVQILSEISQKIKVVFPIHPRTIKNIKKFGLLEKLNEIENIVQLPPQGYLSFLNLIKNAKLVITDSGGIQEETTFLQVPCLTIRPNTERPITSEIGTNTLLPFDANEIVKHFNLIMSNNYKQGQIPPRWDGKTSERIIESINNFFV